MVISGDHLIVDFTPRPSLCEFQLLGPQFIHGLRMFFTKHMLAPHRVQLNFGERVLHFLPQQLGTIRIAVGLCPSEKR